MNAIQNISPLKLLQNYEVGSWYVSNTNTKELLALGVEKEFVLNETTNLEAFQHFLNENKGDYIFGFISYDLKNKFEKLESNNTDELHFPELYFYVPQHVFIKINNGWEEKKGGVDLNKGKAKEIENHKPQLKARISKESYLAQVNKLKEHIQLGDIYEVNFCQEFYDDNASINPYEVFDALNQKAKAPFSSFFKKGDFYALCTSPERYLKKEGEQLISQPIKGTAKRGQTKQEDAEIIEQLTKSPKELAENVMIVDLVRNDLAKISKRGQVQVDELAKLYTFSTVHQLISTIRSTVKEDVGFVDILRATFPMGSMTGAPKIKAMELSEKLESFKRGLYSGTIGYFEPNGDFDFNVVIRSLLYNKERSYLSASFGGAITSNSTPEEEYEETIVKAQAIFDILAHA